MKKVIIVLVILIAAVLIYTQVNKDTPEPVVDPAPSTNPSATADWRIYTNAEYGFEFKYPQDFTVEDGWAHPYSDCSNPIEDQCGFAIRVNREQPNLGLMINFQPDGGLYIDESQIVYSLAKNDDGSVSIASKTSVPSTGGELGDQLQLMKAILKGDDHYIWYMSFERSGVDYQPMFEQILSTFRFID